MSRKRESVCSGGATGVALKRIAGALLKGAIIGLAWCGQAQEYLVKDINTKQETVGSSPTSFVQVGGTFFYFKANDGVHGTELWSSDGTADGTTLVKDIAAGGGSADPGSLVVMGGTLFFTASNSISGRELWRSDGTDAGTVMVKDIVPGAGSSNPTNLVALGNVLFFSAFSSSNGTELWMSDGTDAGTVLVKDILPGTGSSNPQSLTVMNNQVFFSANGGTNGVGLWRSDGTAAGTTLVKALTLGVTNSSPPSLVVVSGPGGSNSTLFFAATTSTNGTELWKSDGTAAGTVMVKDIRLGTASSTPQNLVNVNGTLFFSATDNPLTHGTELWKSDGTDAGTVMVKDILPNAGSSNPQSLIAVTPPGATNSLLFFVAQGTNGRSLWQSDGTSAGTVPVGAGVVTPVISPVSTLVEVNGSVFFAGNDPFYGAELWRTVGTTNGTTNYVILVKDIRAGSLSSTPQSLANINGTLFFSADDGVYGRELWKSDGTGSGTVMVANIRNSDGDSAPANLVNLNNTLFFAASDGASGAELWQSDGTPEGTTLVKAFATGLTNSAPASLVTLNNTLFFSADDGLNGRELWRSDGTASGTVMVKDINPGAGASNPTGLTTVNGTLFFAATDGTNGVELWKSDGTDAGTLMVKDIAFGGASSSPANLLNVNGTLFFTANDGPDGVALWKSDGTAAGTVLLQPPAPAGTNFTSGNLVNCNGTVFFTAGTATNGLELWKSDGTVAGTVLVKDIRPGSLSSSISNLVVVGSTVFFSANDGSTGAELWQSDGTAAGTVLVKDINPGAGGSNPQNLVNVNGRLFFTANDGVNGVELWTSDGTAAGTVMVADIAAGSGSSSPQNLMAVNGILYFSATDGINGRELWQSDGTAAGTFMVGDLTGDSLDSNPGPFTVAGDTLFFAAQTPEVGRELFGYVLNHAPMVVNPLADQTGVYGTAFTLAIPADTFVDEDAGQTLSYTVSGLPPGVSFDAQSLVLSGTLAATGQFTVTLTATDDGSPVPLSATNSFVVAVAKADPAVTWPTPAQIVYGTPLGSSQLNASASTAGTFTYTPPAGTVLNAGADQQLMVAFIPDDPTNYNSGNATVTITVSKAPLTATALDAARTYGAANPAFTMSYAGFANSETASVLHSAPVAATTATATSPVGTYPITLSGGSASNYDLTLVAGTLTVTPALLVITANDASRAYGQANPAFTGTVVGIQNGDNLSASYACAATPNSLVGTYPIVPTLLDPENKQSNYSVTLINGTLTITAAPLLARITGPASGLVRPINTNILFSGTFTKSGGSDSYLASWSFSSDEQPALVTPATVGDGTVSDEIAFAQAGVYAVTLTVTNQFGPSAVATNVNDDLPAYVVIYDPEGGFVTGGGWINSPAGAYLLDPSLAGRATFGFVAKYQKGATVPTGQTQFRFQVADLDFHSSSYDWLVVSGARAQYKGSGTIDGEGNYGFLLTAVDGALTGGGGTDTFRIKLWDKASGVIVYDNETGTSDSGYPTTALQGGSIIIQTK